MLFTGYPEPEPETGLNLTDLEEKTTGKYQSSSHNLLNAGTESSKTFPELGAKFGHLEPSPDYGFPEPYSDYGFPEPAPDSLFPEPYPDYGFPEPDSGYGFAEPDADYGFPELDPSYGFPEPAPDYGIPEPDPDFGFPEPVDIRQLESGSELDHGYPISNADLALMERADKGK